MNVSDRGLKLIADFEGFAPYLYNDPVGHATVGYGILVHTGNYHEQRGVCAACDRWPRRREPRDTWLTPAQGRALLVEKVKPYADAVLRTTRPLRQPEFDALTSLCYNIGPGGYLNSNVRMAVNRNQDPCPALRQIVRGTDGVVYPGLVRRREAECVLFHTEPEEEPMTPEERGRLENVERQVLTTRTHLNELANGMDAVSVANKWPLSVKGLWFVAKRAWPF